ncbi:MAG: 5'-nucleotidase C-terminal domain-containing protein [Bacteroidaceae bacterium]|nr:5'-nucleotidase C-terminal domain-containing protein [Bacteroidaceae bacterium]
MKKQLLFWMSLLMMTSCMTSGEQRTVELKLIETSDLHGSFYPYDFINRRDVKGSLARVFTYVEEQRKQYGDNLLLFDNGDILQGQPSVYYYNYIDQQSRHIAGEMLSFMGYDAGNMGNHDVEVSRPVFDRWAADCDFPILGANIIETDTGKPHFKPYVMFEREGVKIAVLGMITPGIPAWLSENLWEGLRFDDMEETARKYMPILKKKEKADVVIGLFHTGKDAEWLSGQYREHAASEVAQRVPGFDVVLFGHDHSRDCEKVVNVEGDSVLLINPANAAHLVSDVTIKCVVKGKKVISKEVEGHLASVDDLPVSESFMQHFSKQFDDVTQFISRKIGTFSSTITTRPAYFGPSAFIDLIHSLQLTLTGADISFAAPLSYDAQIKKGDVYVSDMFNLYKYENMLYTMDLTGREILGALEYSYSLWINEMKSKNDHVLLFDMKQENAGDGRYNFLNPMFNFDSAAGIIYTVDATKPAGQKVKIESMADGTPFDLDKHYKVAINSYRGNGGGEHLTKGAGIPHDDLIKRVIVSTDKDLRYYLMEYIEQHPDVNPQPLNQWKLVPEEWTKPASDRDYKLLFK